MKVCGIYKIVSPSGKIYIGSSSDVRARMFRYKNLHCVKQTKIYRSLVKYGWDKHNFSVIHECEKEELHMWERLYAEHYNTLGPNGLNLSIPAYNDIKGVFSKETNNARSENMKGEKNHFYGKKHTDEVILRLKAQKPRFIGKKHSPETLLKMKNVKLGKKHSLEARAKMRLTKSLSIKTKPVYNAKPLLDTLIGIYYDSIAEAAKSVNIKRATLSAAMNNPNRIKFNRFIYA